MTETEIKTTEHIETKLDVYLQELVNMINGTTVEFPITIYVNGAILSGHLTSGHNYFDGLKEQYRIFFNSLDKDNQKIEPLLDDLTAARQNYLVDTETKYNMPLPVYIHLRDAKCFTPGQRPMTDEGLWWRGKLSSVDGFHFGKLEQTKG